MADNNVQSIHHVSVIVKDTDVALSFYQGVLGLEIAPERPEMTYGGAWLQVGQQQIHLLELDNPDPVRGRPEHGGRDRHLCLQVRDLDQVIEALDRAGIDYTTSKSGRRAAFTRDPDANAIELFETT